MWILLKINYLCWVLDTEGEIKDIPFRLIVIMAVSPYNFCNFEIKMHRERRQRRKLTPTVMTASFSKESAVK
jgi:hypothetical protein